MLQWLLRMEGTQLLHFRLQLFKSAYQRVRRTQVQSGCQPVQLLGCTHGVSLHAAVVQISDPTGQADSLRVFFHK